MSDDPDDDGAWDIVSDKGLDEPLDKTNDGVESIDEVSGDDTEDVGTITLVVLCADPIWPGSEHARFTATFVPRLRSSINVASFSFDSVEIWFFWTRFEGEVCWETCCTIACFVSPLRVFDVMPDATIVIVLLLVFDSVFTFFAFRKASASARRRVADSGAAGTTNAP